jgi:2-hydroxychromene-2-carboxylate isomerase
VKAGCSHEDAAAVVGDASSSDTKDLLKQTVAEAVELGAFGAPFMVQTKEECVCVRGGGPNNKTNYT